MTLRSATTWWASWKRHCSTDHGKYPPVLAQDQAVVQRSPRCHFDWGTNWLRHQESRCHWKDSWDESALRPPGNWLSFHRCGWSHPPWMSRSSARSSYKQRCGHFSEPWPHLRYQRGAIIICCPSDCIWPWCAVVAAPARSSVDVVLDRGWIELIY